MERRRLAHGDEFLYGIHAVDEALAAGERLRGIHVAADRKTDGALRDLLARARERGVPVRFEERSFFASVPFKAHQGVAAAAPPFSYASLSDVVVPRPDGRARLLVVLDHLTDPHNVGAIIRTAECAGADGVVLPERRSVGVNATVRKSAAGAAAHLPIARVVNVADALRAIKKAGMWVAGARAGPQAQPMMKTDLTGDLALVIGEEGGGLAPLVERECDYLVSIPLRGRVGSLNASVAAGVLLYEVLRQREGVLSP